MTGNPTSGRPKLTYDDHIESLRQARDDRKGKRWLNVLIKLKRSPQREFGIKKQRNNI